VRERVSAARTAQHSRYGGITARTNADLRGAVVSRFCTPTPAGRALLRKAIDRLALTARGYERVLKVARTIADLAGSEVVNAEHVGEALQYRMLE
jgi:magnesium chelatase family protein